MQNPALSQPDRWRQLFRSIRLVYHGPLTYSGWWDVADQIQFWDELDYIGINLYDFFAEPWPGGLDDAIEHLLEGARVLSERYQKQILFTEIGMFSYDTTIGSMGYGAASPFTLAPDLQATWFDTVMGAILENDNFVRGMFVFSVCNDPAFGGIGDGSFVINSKPAAATLQSLYGDRGEIYFPGVPLATPIDEDSAIYAYREGIPHGIEFWAPRDDPQIIFDPAAQNPPQRARDRLPIDLRRAGRWWCGFLP